MAEGLTEGLTGDTGGVKGSLRVACLLGSLGEKGSCSVLGSAMQDDPWRGPGARAGGVRRVGPSRWLVPAGIALWPWV